MKKDSFKLWLEADAPVVSFDFDGVLHTSVWAGTIHPCDFWNPKSWEPNLEMHRKVAEEGKNNRIVVVSSRDREMEDVMWDFINEYPQLKSIEEVYTTNNMSKLSILQRLEAIRHYDDNPDLAHELNGKDIEFIHVKVDGVDCPDRPRYEGPGYSGDIDY